MRRIAVILTTIFDLTVSGEEDANLRQDNPLWMYYLKQIVPFAQLLNMKLGLNTQQWTCFFAAQSAVNIYHCGGSPSLRTTGTFSRGESAE